MSTNLQQLDRQLAQLRGHQAGLSDPGTLHRVKTAKLNREQLETGLGRQLDAIEQMKAEAEALQARLKAVDQRLEKMRGEHSGPRAHQQDAHASSIANQDFERRRLAALVAELLGDPSAEAAKSGNRVHMADAVRRQKGKLGLALERYQADASAAAPRINFCKLVEGGMAEDDARRLVELEQAEAARNMPTNVVEIAIDADGQEVQS